MRDLFGGESLSLRKARSSKKRGELEWTLCSSHRPPSYISKLLFWYSYSRRHALCNKRGTLDHPQLDNDTARLIKTCTIVHPALMTARYYENQLGIRFTRKSVTELIELGTFSKSLKQCYSYSLCYVLLERESIVTQWLDPPTEYSINLCTPRNTRNS